MSAIRCLRLLSATAPRSALRQPLVSKRFLNIDTAPILYTAKANVTGAREGHVEGSEGLKLDLAAPKSQGARNKGTGTGATNPEELFAAGYGACFQSAMNACAVGLEITMPEKAEDFAVETSVHLIGDMKQLDLGIRVDMEIQAKGIKKEDLEKVIAKAKEVCPYARATKGNVTTTVNVKMI